MGKNRNKEEKDNQRTFDVQKKRDNKSMPTEIPKANVWLWIVHPIAMLVNGFQRLFAGVQNVQSQKQAELPQTVAPKASSQALV